MRLMYPGTFDPLTRGHFNIIRRGSRIASELIVGVARKPGRKQPHLTGELRAELIRSVCEAECLANVRVIIYDGSGFDTAISLGCGGVLRGMRDGNDFDYEHEYAQRFCEQQADDEQRLETVFLATCEKHGKTSSTAVRELIAAGGDWRYRTPRACHALLEANLDAFASHG
jgi:pantetheine-phosphate adenylyltransferase